MFKQLLFYPERRQAGGWGRVAINVRGRVGKGQGVKDLDFWLFMRTLLITALVFW